MATKISIELLIMILYSSLLVNRIWWKVTIPILWKLPLCLDHTDKKKMEKKALCIRTYISYKLIQEAQLNANDQLNMLKNVKVDLEQYNYASWIDGQLLIGILKINNGKDIGKNGEVALKKFKAIHIQFCGITQDSEKHSYMMVLEYAKDGNLREYLKINFNNIKWKQKLDNLRKLSLRLMNIHELDIVHQDFHPGNILSYDFEGDIMQISDFGLITGFPPYPDIPHYKNLAMKICNVLRPRIPFHTPKLITRKIMGRDNKDSEIGIQIKKAKEFLADQESANMATT
ncbi:hypothetical protein Glove_176g54 [Diversispora epigaea]|uniref:Protein kinase domain-containing protein n=1 Tax=Diversispora epigaea TaxID=1348612 RepID=A0A397IRI9_9GLOM|nr:hypothetical protein Glove_176g54 [Diversispora epigaea]